MKTAAIILLSLLAITTLNAQGDRVKGWSDDIDFLLARIKQQHYVYKAKPLPASLTNGAEKLKRHISEYSDERMLIEIQALMYHLGDGHSYILPLAAEKVDSRLLPLHFYQFSDGVFVINADEANARFIGMKVRTINGVRPEKILRDMVRFVSQDNVVGAKWIGPAFMLTRGMHERYGLAKGSPHAAIRFDDRHGKTIDATVPFLPPVDFRGIPKMIPPRNAAAEKVPLYLQKVADNYWFRHLPEDQTIYFQFNQVQNKPDETIAAFAARLGAELAVRKPRLLIVDVRHNNGGNGYLNTPLVNMLKDFETTQKGRIVVITGRNTFSAAQIFIGRVDHATNALFAGEPSSSKPNFVGEENEVVLPYSGARGSISNRYHESIPGDTRSWIEPTLKVALTSADYFGNRDPVLDAVLKRYAN